MKAPPSASLNKSPWERERWLKRREAWSWRMVPFIKNLIAEKCGTCQFNGRCHRIPLDSKIVAEAVTKHECSDYKSVWKQILTDEKYEWGF